MVGNHGDILSKSFRDELCALRAFYTVRGKGSELRIVGRVNAAVRDEQNMALARDVGEPADIGEQALGAGDIEFAARQHEVGLSVDLPENDVVAHG